MAHPCLSFHSVRTLSGERRAADARKFDADPAKRTGVPAGERRRLVRQDLEKPAYSSPSDSSSAPKR